MKKLLAIMLPIVALGMVVYTFVVSTPSASVERPKADQWEAVEANRIERTYKESLDRLPLQGDEAEKFAAWQKADADQKLTGDARRAHTKELAKILSPESMAKYKELRSKRAAEKEALAKKKENRLISMMGEADYKKHLENNKRSKELKQAERAARKAAAATPTPGAKP